METKKDEQAVLNAVQRLLDGIENRDAVAMHEILMPNGTATQVRDNVMTQIRLGDLPTWIAYRLFNRTESVKQQFHHPSVVVDRNIAVVLARYDFLINGAVHHWGTAVISLFKESGAWRVASVTSNGWTSPRPADWGNEESAVPSRSA